MKKQSFSAMMMLILAMSTILQAEDFYFGAQGGLNLLYSHFLKERNCGFGPGYNVGVVGGFAWQRGYRVEAEVTYRENPYHLEGTDTNGTSTRFHGKVHSRSYMANGYYDFNRFSFRGLTPYLGGGIGVDSVFQKLRIGGDHFRGSNNSFSWQLMGGVSTCLPKDLLLSLEYKFHASPISNDRYLQNHSVTLGITKFFY